MTHANAAIPDTAAARSSGSWEEFRAPGPWNAPAAYWFWHHIPTRSEIVAQIQAMSDAGYQSFQIQTRLSFPRNRYLSDDYLAMCRLAADEAASRGMMIGIYDEYNWLSGAIRLGGLLHAGVNALTVRITSSAANHYYRGTGLQGDGLARCGLLAPPVLRPVRRWHDIDGLLA